MKCLSIIFLICIVGCKPLSNYEKQIKEYKSYSSLERSESLWDITNSPWAWNYSFQRIKEILKYETNLEYIDSSKAAYTTPLLNASGALECLKMKGTRSYGELDSMEIEAVKIVKYLVSKGANPKYLTNEGRNGFHLAAKGGREKVIPVLAELGLDINLRDSSFCKFTPLSLAIMAGDLATVKAIVDAGADINFSTGRDNTPLDWALGLSKANGENYPYQDQKAIYEYLLSLGAKHGENNFTNWVKF